MRVDVIDKQSRRLDYWRQTFPKISDAKMKEGILVRAQIIQLFEDQHFSTKLNFTGRRAWKALWNVCRNFLGNEKSENYSDIVQELISSGNVMGYSMSLKLHFLHSHLDFLSLKTREVFPLNMAKGSIRLLHKLKREWKMRSKYVGCLLLESYEKNTTGENTRQKKTKWAFAEFFSS